MNSWIRSGLLVAVAVVLGSCTAIGPTRVESDNQFDGIGQLLTAGTESVNVLMIHGMGAERDQEPDKILEQLASRLDLEDIESVPAKTLLLNDPPEVKLGSEPLWPSPALWNADAPTLRILRFNQKDTGLRVNFYLFDYWRALARVKCEYLVAPDTQLIGETGISRICEDYWNKTGRGALPIREPLGARPAAVNRYFKSQIVEWGLADAVIATSEFRLTLRKAIREAMTEQRADLERQRALRSPESTTRTFSDLMQQSQQPASPKFAVITHSLGSYVLFDALADTSYGDPESILCLSRQVHMLANQLPLLRFSEIASGPDSAQSLEASAANNCNSIMMQARIATVQGDIPEVQVVAYHEPNDLLTFYLKLELPPFRFTNVAASFSTVWFPFLAADPMSAHTRQDREPSIMDMLATGHQ